MPSVADIVTIRPCGTYLDQQVCNIFYYLVGVWTGNLTLEDVLDEFITDVLAPIRAIQSTSLTWNELSYRNLTNASEKLDRSISLAGTVTSAGTDTPSYVAAPFTYNHDNSNVRPGAKRFAGLIEGWVSGNAYGGSATPTNALQTALAANLVAGSPEDFRFEPIVLGRNPDGSYNFGQLGFVTSVLQTGYVSTQNSRKRGRGD